MLQYNTRAILVQVAVGLMVALCAVSSGMSLGFSAVVEKDAPPDYLTDEQLSWFTSVSAIVTPLGCLAAGPLLDAVGRKPTLLVLNAPFLAGWLLVSLAPERAAGQLYAGRGFTGFATGMASVPATVYLGEMAQPALRGVFVTWTSIAISVGILGVYLLGSAFRDQWRNAAWICGSIPAIAVPLVFILVPESPIWLAQRGRRSAAEKSLRYLRGVADSAPPTPALETELAALPSPRASASASASTAAPSASCIQRVAGAFSSAFATLAQPEAWKPLLIMNVFFLFQQITGIYVLVSYAVRIVKEAGVQLDEYMASVILGAVQVMGGVVVSLLLKRCGRRPLAVVAGVVQTLAMVALAVYLDVGSDSASWVPLAALSVYVIAGAFGLHTLPWAMLGEVFPARVRGLTAGLTTCMAYIYNFAMLKAYPALEEACKSASKNDTSEYVFYAFAVTSALSVVFVLLWLPETNGRTAQQIEDAFAARGKLNAPEPAEDANDAEKGRDSVADEGKNGGEVQEETEEETGQ